MNAVLFTFFAIVCTGVGFFLMNTLFPGPAAFVGALAGLASALLAEFAGRTLRNVPARTLVGAVIGLLVGLLMAAAGAALLPDQLLTPAAVASLTAVMGICLAYLGLRAGAGKGAEFSLADLVAPLLKPTGDAGSFKILDTSVIIDGRIADICETGFMEGVFLVPQFVLRELQHIADSPDSLKRNRGRRGLDILQRMQKKTNLNIKITDQDFPKIREVDDKLIALAREIKGKIITNDFNLNKVAELNGVPVLNINQLANALKPVVLPGELMKVYILKEGKEMNQGVAYLDDGTMVVVDNARKFIGRNVEVLVTSVLQTTAGRMIFTQLKENGNREAPLPGSAENGVS